MTNVVFNCHWMAANLKFNADHSISRISEI